MRRLLLITMVGVLLSTGCAACNGPAVLTVPLSFREGLPVVPATINGRPVAMTLDTGANRSYVSTAIAARLPPATPGQSMTVAGIATGQRAYVGQLDIAAISVPPLTVGVADLPIEEPTDGGVGLDVLAGFDVELIPMQHTALFWPAGSCSSGLDAWPMGAPLAPARLDPAGQFVVPITVEGTTVDALVDTGATRGLMQADMARRLGLDEGRLDGDSAVAVKTFGGVTLTLREHQFRDVRLAGRALMTNRFAIGDIALPTPVLLGMDQIGAERIFLGFAHGVVGRAGG